MLTKEKYKIILSNILSKLDSNLSKDLWYHGVHHTIDVEKEAERIAISEKITNQEDLLLLKIACLYHDSGFLRQQDATLQRKNCLLLALTKNK